MEYFRQLLLAIWWSRSNIVIFFCTFYENIKLVRNTNEDASNKSIFKKIDSINEEVHAKNIFANIYLKSW